MKKREIQALRDKEIADLSKLAQQKNIEVIKTKAEIKVGKEKNLKKTRNLRRDLAQILSIIREKKISEVESKKEKKL